MVDLDIFRDIGHALLVLASGLRLKLVDSTEPTHRMWVMNDSRLILPSLAEDPIRSALLDHS